MTHLTTTSLKNLNTYGEPLKFEYNGRKCEIQRAAPDCFYLIRYLNGYFIDSPELDTNKAVEQYSKWQLYILNEGAELLYMDAEYLDPNKKIYIELKDCIIKQYPPKQ